MNKFRSIVHVLERVIACSSFTFVDVGRVNLIKTWTLCAALTDSSAFVIVNLLT